MKLYHKNTKRLEASIRKFNLKTEGICASGSNELLDYGRTTLDGGCYIRVQSGKKRPVVAWGAAFSNMEFHVYVMPEFRGRGLASKMIDFAKENFPEHVFCPWDAKTLAIFQHKQAAFTSNHLPTSLWFK